MSHTKTVLITGANGFIGKNLRLALSQKSEVNVISFLKETPVSLLSDMILSSDIVVHLAGIMRSSHVEDFEKSNSGLTTTIKDVIANLRKSQLGWNGKLIYASSAQVSEAIPYGVTKKESEDLLLSLSREFDIPIKIYRFCGIFGKWAKPNYNSVVSTFIHNVQKEKPLEVLNDKRLVLLHIDQVVELITRDIDNGFHTEIVEEFEYSYQISVSDLKATIQAIHRNYKRGVVGETERGLMGALYSTYVSQKTPEETIRKIEKHSDDRGCFVECFHTEKSGQISYCTIEPGKARGNHYHHRKIEKFLVLSGAVEFVSKNLVTGDIHSRTLTASEPTLIDSIPGWIHSLRNPGGVLAVVLIWTNERFVIDDSDTYVLENKR